MPPRIGNNGGVVKLASSTKSQRNARPTGSNVIDLTRESTDETSGNNLRGESATEEESDDASEHHGERSDGGRRHKKSSAGTQGRASGAGQATISRPKTNNHQRVARPGQEYTMEDSFIVTSLYHRPWGAGDDNTTIGVFSTEGEAKDAAYLDFQQVESKADGWESEWRRLAGDGMLQLRGYIEDGEKDIESYKASIKPFQQKRPVAVQPNVPSATRPKPTVAKPRYVYVVKEEQRIKVGEDDQQGFYNELGDLKAVEIHGIYANLEAANGSAREIYDGIVEDLDGVAETVTDELSNGKARMLVENKEEMMTYSIRVEMRTLK